MPQTKIVRIGIIDTGFNVSRTSKAVICPDGLVDLTGEGVEDTIGHGTHVTNLIADRLTIPNYCFIIVKYYKKDTLGSGLNTYKAFEYLSKQNVDVINYSSSGGAVAGEKEILQEIVGKGINVFVAAGNQGRDLDLNCSSYPGCYRIGINMIGNGTSLINRHSTSNYGQVVTQWENGIAIEAEVEEGKRERLTGTSMATGIATAKWVNGRFK